MLDWPWADLSLDDFEADPVTGVRTAILTPDQATALAASPEGGVYGVTVTGPDRVPYSIALKPLLPEETE